MFVVIAIVLMVAAGYLICRTEKIELTDDLSRCVLTLIALYVYYTSKNTIDWIPLDFFMIANDLNWYIEYIIHAGLVLLVVYFGYRSWKNREDILKKFKKQTVKISTIVALLVTAKFLMYK